MEVTNYNDIHIISLVCILVILKISMLWWILVYLLRIIDHKSPNIMELQIYIFLANLSF